MKSEAGAELNSAERYSGKPEIKCVFKLYNPGVIRF
jgi:hypothetical protein